MCICITPVAPSDWPSSTTPSSLAPRKRKRAGSSAHHTVGGRRLVTQAPFSR